MSGAKERSVEGRMRSGMMGDLGEGESKERASLAGDHNQKRGFRSGDRDRVLLSDAFRKKE